MQQLIKYIKIKGHIFLDNFKSFKKGWLFHFTRNQDKVYSTDSLFLIAEFVTKIKWREELGGLNLNRIYNMKQAAQKINGICLKPGQIFSMFKTVGEAKKINGI